MLTVHWEVVQHAKVEAFQNRSFLDADLLDNFPMKRGQVVEAELAGMGDMRGEQR